MKKSFRFVLFISAFLIFLPVSPMFTAKPSGTTSSLNEAVLESYADSRVVVAELFTATWCGFCPYATQAINKLADEYGSRNLVVLQYHPTSDPFGDSETNARGLSYYGIPGYPTVVFDGTEKTVGGWDGAYDSYNATISSELQKTSDVFISITGSPDDFIANVSSSSSIQSTPAKIRSVVYEDNIPFDAPNGEKILRFVVRNVLNDEVVTLAPGQTLSIRRAFQPLDGWNLTNLGLVVFVQRDDTKKILQAAALNPSPTFSLSSLGTTVSVVQPNQSAFFEAQLLNIGKFDDNFSLALTKYVPPEWTAEFCLGSTCYLNSAAIQLKSGSSQNITIQIITSASEASGNVTLTAVSQHYASQTYSIVFTALSIRQLLVSFDHQPSVPWINESAAFISSSNATTFTWSFGDGNNSTASQPTINHTYSSSGNYIVTLYITDGLLSNNTSTEITVTFRSDLNRDKTVNIIDVSIVATDFGSEQGDQRWNATGDLDSNSVINIVDVTMVAKDYGKKV